MKDFIKKYFNYIVISVVLLIPFIYSFFYLKAYWDPYGKGNIDNIPVAIVNNDNGNYGNKLIKSIKNSKKLKIKVVDDSKAKDGLDNGNYYAVINIPSDFTNNLNSASTTSKKHPTITYSPNQKSNYLASQIINSVVNAVEKNLDNEVNSKIVHNLTNNIKEVPNKLDTINDGFNKLKDGTNKLSNGSKKLVNGTNVLASNYNKFNDGVFSINNGTTSLSNGVKKVNDGINTLSDASSQFNSLSNGINELTNGVNNLKVGSDSYTTNYNNYVTATNTTLTYSKTLANYINSAVCPTITDPTSQQDLYQLCLIAQNLTTAQAQYGGINTYDYLIASGNSLKNANTQINSGINSLHNNITPLNQVPANISKLQSGLNELKSGSNELLNGAYKLNDGSNNLYTNSLKIRDGINTINNGTNTLNNGMITLDSSVLDAKDELSLKISNTRKELKKVDKLDNYSKAPIKVKTKEVNKVSSYGTAFSPLFISIGLWVGCLMMFIVLYYDKKERFGILSETNKQRIKRNAIYHLLITISSFILGILPMFL